MDYEPDWKSKLLVALLGKRRAMTLLDTGELMFKEEFKATPTFEAISNQVIYSAVGANLAAVLSSILLSKTVFARSKFLSPLKLLADCALVFTSYYFAAIYLSQSIRQSVQESKAVYLKRFNEDFLFHFNYLAAKYQIEEELQVEGIFSREEFAQWMNDFYAKIPQKEHDL
jgi:hypothetical protein